LRKLGSIEEMEKGKREGIVETSSLKEVPLEKERLAVRITVLRKGRGEGIREGKKRRE